MNWIFPLGRIWGDAIEKEQVLIFNWLYDTAVQRRSLASDFHACLTDILAQGPAIHADEAMREHIRHGLGKVLSNLDLMVDPKKGWRHKK